MSDLILKITPRVSQNSELPKLPLLGVEPVENATTVRGKIPLTVRKGLRVLRVAPPVDDGFRPFRVF